MTTAHPLTYKFKLIGCLSEMCGVVNQNYETIKQQTNNIVSEKMSKNQNIVNFCNKYKNAVRLIFIGTLITASYLRQVYWYPLSLIFFTVAIIAASSLSKDKAPLKTLTESQYPLMSAEPMAVTYVALWVLQILFGNSYFITGFMALTMGNYLSHHTAKIIDGAKEIGKTITQN